MSVRPATADDLPALLPLIYDYCAFYEVTPRKSGIEAVCQARLGDPERNGPLLVAVDGEGAVVGFAALTWKQSHLDGGEVAYLHDLFVSEPARGAGHADALIEACAERARQRGCVAMEWLTDPGNARARAVYERSGAVGETEVEYRLAL